MRFSVVIPLFNKAPQIKRAIDSVLNQTYQEYEIIVVNDGSTDGGETLVEKYQEPKIRVIYQINSGVSAARNKGIHESKGEFIAFLDADDEWAPEFLITINNLINRFPGGGIYATGYQFNHGNNILIKNKISNMKNNEIWAGMITNYFAYTLRDSIITASSAVIPKEVFNKVGYFPEDIDYGEDLEMWFDIARAYPIVYDSSILVDYHQPFSNQGGNAKPHLDVLSVSNKALEYLKKGKLLINEKKALRKMIIKYNILICKNNIEAGNLKKSEEILNILKPAFFESPQWYICNLLILFPSINFANLKKSWTNNKELECLNKALSKANITGPILNYSCGTGKITEVLFKKGYQVTVADISPEILNFVDEHKINIGGEVKNQLNDINYFDFHPESFEMVVAIRLLNNIHPSLYPKILNQLFNVTKKWALISYSNKYTLQNFRRNIISFYTKFPRYAISSMMLKKEISEAGFKIVKYMPILPFFSETDYLLLEKTKQLIN